MDDKEKLDILIEGLKRIIDEAQKDADSAWNRFNQERKWQDEAVLERLATAADQDGLWASRMRGLLSKVTPIRTYKGD